MRPERKGQVELIGLWAVTILVTGCVGEGEQHDLCQMAMDHMGACVAGFQYSDTVACDQEKQETANFLLGLDCSELQAVYAAGQEVSWYEDVWDMAQGVADGVRNKYESTMDDLVGPDFRISDVTVDPIKGEYYVEGTWEF